MDSTTDLVPVNTEKTPSSDAVEETTNVSNENEDIPNSEEPTSVPSNEDEPIEESVAEQTKDIQSEPDLQQKHVEPISQSEDELVGEPMLAEDIVEPSSPPTEESVQLVETPSTVEEDNSAVETETTADQIDSTEIQPSKDENIIDDDNAATDNTTHSEAMEVDDADVADEDVSSEPATAANDADPDSTEVFVSPNPPNVDPTETTASSPNDDPTETTESNIHTEAENADTENQNELNSEMEVDSPPTANPDASLNQSVDLEEQHRPEEVDMEDVGETSISEKEKACAEDPFDSVKQNTSLSNENDSIVQTVDELDATINNTLDESAISEQNATNQDESVVGNVDEPVTSKDDEAAEGKH